MRKKLNNKQLLLIFSALLTLVILIFTSKNSKRESSFSKQLVEVKKEEITQLKLYPKQLKGALINITKEGDEWIITDGKGNFRANPSLIDDMVSELENLEAKSLVANSKDKWNEFEVSDSLAACRVQLYSGSKKEADLYIGKFKFSQPRNMSTYVRIDGKKQTFKVDGFLSSTFNRKVNDLRDKTIFKDPIANWSKITFDYPSDSSFVLSRSDNKWMIDGVLADSVSVAGYINSLKNQSGITISNAIPGGSVLYQITIERNKMIPVVIQVKENENEKLLTSSENKDVWFSDKNLIDKIFVPKSKFRIN